jgi:hypothetical protein
MSPHPRVKAAAENADSAKKYKTKSGEQPESYKLYDGDNLYIEIFLNGSKIWRFRFKFPKENVISLGKHPKVSLAKAREERDKCLDSRSKTKTGMAGQMLTIASSFHFRPKWLPSCAYEYNAQVSDDIETTELHGCTLRDCAGWGRWDAG